MGYVLAAFHSRTQVMRFLEAMKRNGCAVSVVNTPKDAHVGCGLSVKMPYNCLKTAKRLISYYRFDAFVGFFEVRTYGGRTTLKTI